MHITMLRAINVCEIRAKLLHIRPKIDGIRHPVAKQIVIHSRHRHKSECDRLYAMLRRAVVQRSRVRSSIARISCRLFLTRCYSSRARTLFTSTDFLRASILV